jgi:hypothetical protein
MKKQTTILLLSAFASLIIMMFSACNKDLSSNNNPFSPYLNNSQNDTVWSTASLHKDATTGPFIPALTSPSFKDSFNCTTGATLAYGDSLQVIFPPNAYTSNNGAITSGYITFEVTILQKKGDFIRYDKPTVNYTSILESGGYVYARLSKNGQPVYLSSQASIHVKVKDTLAKTDMNYFVGFSGKYASDSLFCWAPNSYGKVSIWYDTNPTTYRKLGYDIQTNMLGWFGASFYTDSTPPLTRLNVILPVNFTNKNTEVFAVFKNRKTVVNLLPDFPSRSFYALNIPANTTVTLVSVTKINSNYYLGTNTLQVTNANPITIKPQLITIQQLSNFLDSL